MDAHGTRSATNRIPSPPRRTPCAMRNTRTILPCAVTVLPALLWFTACDRVRTRPEADADVAVAVFRDMLSDDKKPFALTAVAVRPGAYTHPQAREAVVSFTDLNQSASNNRAEVWLLRRQKRWRADRRLAEADEVGCSTIDVDGDGALEVWVVGRSARDGVVSTGGSLISLSSVSYSVLYSYRGYDRTALEEPGPAYRSCEVRFRDSGKHGAPILEETSVTKYFSRHLRRGVTWYVEVASVTRTMDHVLHHGRYVPIGFAVPTEEELRDPLTVAVPTVRPSTAVARVPEIVPAADLRNVAGNAALEFLDAYEREVLAKNGCVITAADARSASGVFAPGHPPYIGPGVVVYLYRLLADKAQQSFEREVLAEKLYVVAAGAAERLRGQMDSVPYTLRTPVRAAYAHVAAIAMLMNPEYAVDPDSTVALAVSRARLFVAPSSGAGGIDTPADRSRRARDLAAAMPFRCETPDGIRAAALLSLAIWSDADVLDAYRVLRRSLRFLEGPPEADGPEEVLRAVYRVCGPVAKPSALSDPKITAALIRELGGIGTKSGFAAIPRGAPVIQRMTNRLAGPLKGGPTGAMLAYVLGNDAAGLDAAGAKAAAPLRGWMAAETVPKSLAAGADAETWLCAALRSFGRRTGSGMPWYLRRPSWALVTLNTQLAGWCFRSGDHGTSSSAVRSAGADAPPVRSSGTFPGYVEPVPQFYAVMGALTAYTQRMLAAYPGVSERLTDRFRDLETLCFALQRVAGKFLMDESLDAGDAAVLDGFARLVGRFESELAGGASGANTPTASLAELGRSKTAIRYAATGRPLRIIALVPSRGRLYWASGVLPSYYEFETPAAAPLHPDAWRRRAADGYVADGRIPFLWRSGLGLGGRPPVPAKTPALKTSPSKPGSAPARKTPAKK